MDSDDDEKRRVMTPPESWSSGGANQSDASPDTLGDDSWLDDALPAMALAEDGESDLTPPASAGDETDTDSGLGGLTTDEVSEETMPSFHPDVDATVADATVTPTYADETVQEEDDWLGEGKEPVLSRTSAAGIGPAPEAADDLAQQSPAPTETPSSGASPTAALGAVNAQMLDEELIAETQGRDNAAALLTDHESAASTTEKKGPPLVMMATVLIGIALVAAGGWGVFQDRAALKARITQLETDLNNATRSAAGDLSSEEEQALYADNDALRQQLGELQEQYSGLSIELDQLQAMIEVTQGQPLDSSAGPTDGPAARDSGDLSQDTTTIIPPPTQGEWFVNVASYSRRDIAEEWASKLEALVTGVSLQEVNVDGDALYRVRVMGYANKGAAQDAARALELRYGTGPLWVGKDTPGQASAGNLGPAVAGIQPVRAEDTVAVDSVDGEGEGLAPATLKSASGWFVFVDSYEKGNDAIERANAIRDAGFDAKVAVESRQGELFYRVQVVGIDSQSEGEAAVKALAQLNDMPNLQLRRY